MQSNLIEQLRATLQQTADPQKRVDLLNEIAYLSEATERETSLAWYEEAEKTAVLHQYERSLADSLAGQAKIWRQRGQYDRAFGLAIEAKKLYETQPNPFGLHRVYQTLAAIYWHLGDFAQALTHAMQGLEIAKQLADFGLLAQSYEGIGITYLAMGELDTFQQLLTTAWEYEQQTAEYNFRRRASILNNLAFAYSQTQQHAQAMHFAKQSLETCQQVGDSHLEVNILDTLGNLYVSAGQTEEGIGYYQQAAELAGEIGASYAEAESLLNLGRIHHTLGAYKTAVSFIEQALARAASINAKPLQYQGFELLAQIFEAQGILDKALYFFKQFAEVKEAVYREQSESKVKTLEMIHRKEEEARSYQARNQALEAEIERRERVEAALLQAKEEAEVANQAKSDFLSRMSHELRTPLNGILGYAQLLKAQGRVDDGLGQRAAAVIQESGEHLLTLINDILDLAKIEAQKLELNQTAVFLPPFWQSIEGMVQIQAAQKGLALTVSIDDCVPESIITDPTRLRQTLLNLLGNAVKFTDNGTISLEVSAQAVDATHCTLLFMVSDSGAGISAADLTRIFQPFEQVRNGRLSHSRSDAGTGLGLAISQQIVTTMGGAIQVESRLGQGSRFWFTLSFPIVEQETAAAPDQPTMIRGYAGKPRKLLVIDDVAHNRSLLRDMLEPLGFAIQTAVSATAGIQLAQQCQPDLIFVDLMLPDRTTAELLTALQTVETIFVATSANSEANEDNPAFAAFLPKPFRRETLLQLLETTLGLKWEYGREETENGRLPTPPPEQIAPLLELAKLGDLHALKQAAKTLAAEDPTWQPFCHRLVHYANHFEETKIMTLLTPS